MDLYQRLRQLQIRFRLNEILFVSLLLLSTSILLLLIIVGLFINKLVFIALVPIFAVILYKSKTFITIKQLTSKVEGYFPEFKNKLIPAVELYCYEQKNRSAGKEGYSLELIKSAIEDVTKKLKQYKLENIINYRKTWYALILTLLLLCSLLTFRILQREVFVFGWNLAFAPQKTNIAVHVVPGNTYVNKDSIVKINYQIHAPVKSLKAKLYANQQKFADSTVYIKAENEIKYFVSIYSALGIKIFNSPVYYIRINQPIEIVDLYFTYHYPAYTKLPPQQSRSTLIKAIAGTKVAFTGKANVPLTKAEKVSGFNKIESLKVRDNVFEGSFVITKQDSFVIFLSGENYHQSKSPIFYVTPTPDEVPFVRIFLPGRDIDMPVSMQVLVGIYGIDDFGLNRLELFCRRAGVSESVRIYSKS
ncbi:MAG: hypothetical protein N2748_02275, partial [candidate division WOR-3 bacterium]|nr:hypothetical protein [candidate division WOR-3 bacterium]